MKESTPHLKGWRWLRRGFQGLMRVASLSLVAILGLALAGCSHGSSNHDSAPVITSQPLGTTVISGHPVNLYVSVAGTSPFTYQWTRNGQTLVGAQSSVLTLNNPGVQDSGQYVVTVTNSLGSVTSTPATLTVVAALTFTYPYGVVSDSAGNLYVSDANAHAIWKIDPTRHKTLLAGTPGVAGSANGPGTSAQFRYPSGLAFDPSGNLLVADTGNDTIRAIAPNGTVSTLAGSPGMPGYVNAQGAQARFNAPIGLAISPTGTLYIADSQNHVIRQMAPDGTVSPYAGTPNQPGLQNGNATSALFNQPSGLALGSDGTLYIADYGNSSIRTLSPAGQVATLTGQTAHGFNDGSPATALFHWPAALTVDASGVVWVADTANHAIRKVLADGTVSTFAGSGGNPGKQDGTGTGALFNSPCGLAFTPTGTLVVADTGNGYLRAITPAGVVTTFTAP